jgi:hypothetical protein
MRDIKWEGLVVLALFVIGIAALGVGYWAGRQPADVTAVEEASRGLIDITDVSVTSSVIEIYLIFSGEIPAKDFPNLDAAFTVLITNRYESQKAIVLLFLQPSGATYAIAQVNICDGPELIARGVSRVPCSLMQGSPDAVVSKEHLRWKD